MKEIKHNIKNQFDAVTKQLFLRKKREEISEIIKDIDSGKTSTIELLHNFCKSKIANSNKKED